MSVAGSNERKAHAKEMLKQQRVFKEDLVKIRRERGLSQAQVAQILGLTQSAVAQFERYDSNPTLGSIRRYALAVGANVSMTATKRGADNAAPMSMASDVESDGKTVEYLERWVSL